MRRFSLGVLVAVAASLMGAATAVAANQKPKACFTQTPAAPRTGETVTFSSQCSTDEDGRIAGRAWDLDNDGDFDDGTGVTASRAWAAPGSYTVRLGVVDNNGATATMNKTVTVANRGPVAGFSFSPAEPVAGQTVSLTSTSVDPDGTLTSQSWDLDNDGSFDDANGASASFTPTAAGSYPVAIRVVDNRGAVATASKTFVVSARAADPPPSGSQPQPTGPAQSFDDSFATSPEPPVSATPTQLRWLDPFPVVRIRGRTTSSGVILSLFTVRAPAGARVELLCSGRSCPAEVARKRVTAPSGRSVASVRFRALERRLRAGTRLQVRVTKTGLVGKYTRFRIRRIKLPVRSDRCLMPGSGRPVACPAAPPG